MEVKRSSYYATLLDEEVKKRYDEKIKKCDDIDPYTLEDKTLSLNREHFPYITTSDIANYVICSVSPFTNQSNRAYKSTEAHRFFDSGFVLDLGSKTISNDNVILKGRVKHSQKMNEAPLQVWVLASISGQIICAHCTCVAGLSETCSHVGAICYAVLGIHESTEEKSVTELLCKWNVPNFKNVSMKPAIDIEWKLLSQEPTRRKSNFRLNCDLIAPFSDSRINEFIKKCNSFNDETALETILFPFKVKRRTNLRDQVFLSSIYCVDNQNKSLNELIQIGASEVLDISDEEVQEICRITLPHLKSTSYVGLQRGRITGSNLKDCCVSSITNPCIATINRVMNPFKLDDVSSMKYNNKNKKKAIEFYLRETVPCHIDFQHKTCGLIINQKYPYLAASPDGLVNCDCHGDGCVVVKCLKILSCGGSVEVLTSKPNNILNKQETGYVLEKTHEFYYQIQFQINLVELDYCDLVIWSPNETLLVRICPDKDFWRTVLDKASRFHARVMIPELLGKFYTKNSEKRSSVREDTDENKEVLVALEIELFG